jgi:hypothetical protein
MKHRRLSATEVARNFSDVLNQVRYQSVTVDVTRGREVIAQISPAAAAGGLPIAELGRLFAALPPLGEEAEAFVADIDAGLAQLRRVDHPWGS